MSNVRNWYIYLTGIVSLNTVLWAVITFLRTLVNSGIRLDLQVLALQVAIIIIGGPLFLLHWLWAQRLVSNDEKERHSSIRRLYLYVVLAGTVGPFLANSFSLFVSIIQDFAWLVFPEYIVTVIPLAAVFAYHQWVLFKDINSASPSGDNATIRRLYIYGFSGAGLWMITVASINLLEWIFLQFSRNAVLPQGTMGDISRELVRFLIGLIVWIYFSRWAERLFGSPSTDEQSSVLRKFYLYLAVFVAVLSTVGTATALLAGIMRRLLFLPPSGNLQQALAMIIGMGVVWGYHAYLLRRDASAAPDVPSQLGVRRLHLYLVAGIGLGAFLIGLVGNLNLLIDVLSSTAAILDSQKEQFTWFTSGILSGLGAWVLPWRTILASVVNDNPQAPDNRNSLVRRIYLYFYLFVAVMAMLGSLIYIVFQVLLLLLGERTFTLLINDLAQALSYTFVGLVVLVYHSLILRADGRIAGEREAEKLQEMNIYVLDGEGGEFGLAMQKAIASEFPQASVTLAGMNKAAAEAMGQEFKGQALKDDLAESGLIVAPWYVILDVGKGSGLAGAVADSPARKLLVPLTRAGWDWAGLSPVHQEQAAREAIKALEQIIKGEEVKATRQLGCVGFAAILIGGFVLLNLLVIGIAFAISF